MVSLSFAYLLFKLWVYLSLDFHNFLKFTIWFTIYRVFLRILLFLHNLFWILVFKFFPFLLDRCFLLILIPFQSLGAIHTFEVSFLPDILALYVLAIPISYVIVLGGGRSSTELIDFVHLVLENIYGWIKSLAAFYRCLSFTFLFWFRLQLLTFDL